MPSLVPHEDRKAAAGLADALLEVERRDERREDEADTRVGLDADMRTDRVLEFRVMESSMAIGDITGEIECPMVFPSGIVCGETVIRFNVLSVLSVMLLPLVVGEIGDNSPSSRMGDVINADVGETISGDW